MSSTVVFISVFAVAIVITVIVAWLNGRRTSGHQVSCNIQPETYPEVSGVEQCRDLQGNLLFRWYDSRADATLQKFADTTGIPRYQDVCSQWCDRVELPYNCMEPTARYNDCVTQLRPADSCPIPAMPVARSGSDLVYIVGRGKLCL